MAYKTNLSVEKINLNSQISANDAEIKALQEAINNLTAELSAFSTKLDSIGASFTTIGTALTETKDTFANTISAIVLDASKTIETGKNDVKTQVDATIAAMKTAIAAKEEANKGLRWQLSQFNEEE